MPSTTILFLLGLLFSITTRSTTSSSFPRNKHHRHLLHQPFFPPLDSSPTTLPPSPSPQPQPHLGQQPKLPSSSSSSSSSTPPKPFFPSYPSANPPPSPTALATFPANISDLLLPHPNSSSISHRHLIAIAVSVSLLIFALFSGFSAFLYCRKNTYFTTTEKTSHSDNLRLYPSNIDTSDGTQKHPRSVPSHTSSEFLYLGTLANPCGINDEEAANSSNACVSPSTQYQKLLG